MSFLDIVLGNSEFRILEKKYKERGEALQSWKDGYEQLKPAYDTLAAEVQPLKAKCQELERKVKTRDDQNKQLEKDNAELAATVTPLKEQVTALEAEIRDSQETQEVTEAKLEAANNTRQLAIETMNRELGKARNEIEALTRKATWVKLAEVEDEIGFRGYLSTGQILEPSIIRVKQQHLKEIPVRVEAGEEYYEDGGHYPIDLMDFIRTGKTLNRLAPVDNISTTDTTDDDLTENERKVKEYVTDIPGAHAKEMVEALEIDKGNMSRLLKALVAKEIIFQDDEGGYRRVEL